MTIAASLTTEAQLQAAVIELAHLRGWKVAHFRPAQTAKGWRTPVQGDNGFPDLVLARRGDVLLIELKSEKGKVEPEQLAWGEAIGITWKVWRPSDWDLIQWRLG